MTRDGYVLKRQLKLRGWTTQLIKRFLVTPDQIDKADDRLGSFYLYSIKRVESIEKEKDFIQFKKKLMQERHNAYQAIVANVPPKFRDQIV
tara:strand:- start:2248 stop:2520 length:273 start_codon:yes stop_codon:yes gene_type:complete